MKNKHKPKTIYCYCSECYKQWKNLQKQLNNK